MDNHIKGSVNDVWKGLLAGSARDLSDIGQDGRNRFAKNSKLSWPYVVIPYRIVGDKTLKPLNIYLALAHPCLEVSDG